MQRLDEGVPGRPKIAPVHRPHAPEQVAHLRRRVVEELRNDLDRAQRQHHGGGRDIEGVARQALHRGEAPPVALKAGRDAHWNTRLAQPDTISAAMISATMTIRIASTKSKSKR